MSDHPGAVIPGDPRAIRLSYHHWQRWSLTTEDQPETWQVSADLVDDGDEPVDHVGDLTIVTVDLDQTHDPFGVLDGESADLGLVAEAIFDPVTGGLHLGLDRHLEPSGGRILVIDDATLAPRWRGHGLGMLLAGTAIQRLSGGARAAACYPAPRVDGDDPLDDTAWEHAVNRISHAWSRLGFRPFRRGVYVLDLNLVTLEENLRGLRAQAERLRPWHEDAAEPGII